MHPLLLGSISLYFPIWGIAIGVAAATAACWAPPAGLPRWRSVSAVLALAVFIIVGARLWYWLEVFLFPHIEYGPAETRVGVRVQGGIVLLAAALPLVCGILRLPWLRFGDVMLPLAGLAVSIIRIGCFLAGCCFGKVADVPWALTFPVRSWVHSYHLDQHWIAGSATRSLPVHPLQLYFAGAAFLSFAAARLYYSRQTTPGQTQLLFYILFFTATALLEPLRELYAPVNTSFFAFAGVCMAMFLARRTAR